MNDPRNTTYPLSSLLDNQNLKAQLFAFFNVRIPCKDRDNTSLNNAGGAA